MNHSAFTVLALTALAYGGCGALAVPEYPDRLIGAAGQEIVLDDLEEIANDVNLTDDQKRDRFRELGIEDEKLIDALLTL